MPIVRIVVAGSIAGSVRVRSLHRRGMEVVGLAMRSRIALLLRSWVSLDRAAGSQISSGDESVRTESRPKRMNLKRYLSVQSFFQTPMLMQHLTLIKSSVKQSSTSAKVSELAIGCSKNGVCASVSSQT
jgi:hypothetical protein